MDETPSRFRAAKERMDGTTSGGATGAAAGSGGAAPRADEPEQPAHSLLERIARRVMPRARSEGTGEGTGEAQGAETRKAAADERTLLANVLKMRDQRVEDVMIPRADIVAAPETATLDELIAIFREASLSRVPIFRETLDDPIGFAHLKDLAFAYGFDGPERRAQFDIHRHLRQLLYVPPSMATAKLLERMQASRKHMALIIDEYGGVDGLVTIEDLVEQIVGEIDDEHDDADPAPWREESPGVYLANARADVAEFEAAAGVDLLPPDLDEDVDTLGGLVFMLSNRVPERGEVITTADGHEFEVIDADPRRIKRLRVTLAGRAAPQPGAPDAAAA